MSNFSRELFLGLLFTVLGATSFAQSNLNFTHLTNIDGLSQSTVVAIVKDKMGFMWFGTQDGLNRYDGYNFKVYRHKPNDTTSLRRSHITSVYEDMEGNLWVGTLNGSLSLLDRQHDKFINYKVMTDKTEGLSQRTVTSMYEDKQNNFWVGTYWKLNLLNRKTGSITQYGNVPGDSTSISDDGINCIFEDSRNNLWVGTNSGLNIFDRKTKKFERFFQTTDSNSLSNNNIRCIKEDAHGRLWIGTSNGLNLFNYASKSFTRFLPDSKNPNWLADSQISAIDFTDDGKLWLGTKLTLELFDVDKGIFTHFQNIRNKETSLKYNGNISALLQDKDGILWVGTYQGGINKYDKHLTYFTSYRNNVEDNSSLSFNIVTAFAENRDGNVWIGTGGGALNLWNRSDETFTRYNPDPANKNALANWGILCLDLGKKSNYLWIGMYGSCIDRLDTKTGIFKHYTKGTGPGQLNNDAVYAVMEDSRGNVWMGTNGGGVNVLDPVTGIITKYMNNPENENSVVGNFIRCFFEDKNGDIWIGSSDGTSIFNPATHTFTHFSQAETKLESNVINAIYEDRKGFMWIGTLGGGLNKVDAITKKVTTYTSVDGLAGNTIYSIIEDNYGYIWVSTSNGISRLNFNQQIFKNSTLSNGIQSSEFSIGAGIKTSNGDLLMGGINGFNVIEPNRIIENRQAPPVVISDFRLFNKSQVPGEKNSPLRQGILETKNIILNYDQSIITIEFAALGFTASEKNQYAYVLEGFEKAWNYVEMSRTATYTNLNPGKYIFKVKAANNDGIWNDKYTSLVIIIKPPYWQSWWFRILILVLIIWLVTFIYGSRMRSIRQQKLMLEQQVLERTESLAAMTMEERNAREEADLAKVEVERKNKELEQFAYVASHDLQEPLRTTSSFVELLQRQYHGKLDAKADKYLAFIAQSSDRMKVLIKDLLDYSRIGTQKELATVDCNAVLKTVIADLKVLIEEAGGSVKSDALPIISGYPTEIKLLFQNLVINAIKFRKPIIPPVILISVQNENNFWQFACKDNGIGIQDQHKERIFIIFQRLHTRNDYEGSGIGLSHCKKIVELHGGKIWVESAPGTGSTFYFTIPKKN